MNVFNKSTGDLLQIMWPLETTWRQLFHLKMSFLIS